MASEPPAADLPSLFEPYVWSWFEQRFGAPTPPQVESWPRIAAGQHTLIFSPTGSGKTLAAFLWCLNELYRAGSRGELADSVYVLYVSPLKALNNDIQRNLIEPLEGISRAAEEAGIAIPEVRSEVRTGDTPAAARTAMAARPPHILITTPESLFIILSTQRFRFSLSTVQFVIVDEIHAVSENKRGVHLSLSLERLRELTDDGFVRIGLSATQKPLEKIAGFLTGFTPEGLRRPCQIVDIGARKNLDVQVVTPVDNLSEARFDAIWASVYDRILAMIRDHDTTLIFARSRYKAERTSLRLNELADDEDLHVGAHHGSMSRQIRLDMETRLKRGELDGLVATASLELGIDVGSIDLVCQLESPHSMSRGMQRIGRAGHLLDATSKGRLLVVDRDDLVEATVLVRAILDGQIDASRIPTGCLDVLAQHVVGAVAADEWDAESLYQLCRGSYCYRDLERESFDRVLGMLSGAFRFDMERDPYPRIQWDRVNDRLTPERGARVISFRSSGTIPDEADYDVYLVEKKTRLGILDEDFVDDLRRGDIFVLGSSSWRVLGFRRNRVLVEDAQGRAPTVPFWHGHVRTRTADLGRLVGAFRGQMHEHMLAGDAEDWLRREYCVDENGVQALCEYFRQQQLIAGIVPTDRVVLAEHSRDELGQERLVVHCSFGGRINDTWATVLCHILERQWGEGFQRAVVDDGILITIPPAAKLSAADLAATFHSLVDADQVDELLAEAVLSSPVFSSRFRHNAVRSLQVLREYQGRRMPVWIQSARASELLEASRQRHDYPVIAETVRECVVDALDGPALGDVLKQIQAGEIEIRILESRAPSPFSNGLLLLGQHREDKAGSEPERRSQLMHVHREVLRQILDEESLANLLDVEAADFVESKLQFTHPHRRARRPDELARAFIELGDLVEEAGAELSLADRVEGDPASMLGELVEQRRVVAVPLSTLETHPQRWIATESFSLYRDAFRVTHDPDAEDTRLLTRLEGRGLLPLSGLVSADPEPPGRRGAVAARHPVEERLERLVYAYRVLRFPGDGEARYASVASWVPTELIGSRMTRTEAHSELVLRYLRRHGPVTKYEIMARYGLPERFVEGVLENLQQSDRVASGEYVASKAFPQWCYRRNLEEIHRRTLERLRREIEPATAEEYADFLMRWQHVHPDTRLSGIEGLRQVIAQIQGLENYQVVHERHLFPARLTDYEPAMLDRLCYGGEVAWRRFGPRQLRRGHLGFCCRGDRDWIATGRDATDVDLTAWDEDIPEACDAVRSYLADNSPCFYDDLLGDADLPEAVALRAIWHLVWTGEATNDSFESIRHAEIGAGISACYDGGTRVGSRKATPDFIVENMRARKLDPRLGRWVATEQLRKGRTPPMDPEKRAAGWANLLISRWGFLCRDVVGRETCAPPWRDLLRAAKRLELLGKVQRGYFIEDLSGEQYAPPEAVEALRAVRLRRPDPEEDEVEAVPDDEPMILLNLRDPANPFDGLFDLTTALGETVKSQVRISRTPQKHLVFRAGQPLVLYDRAGAMTVLADLTRAEMEEALSLLLRLAESSSSRKESRIIYIRDWNGHPIDVSPARHLLTHLGFSPATGTEKGLAYDSAEPPSSHATDGSEIPQTYECLGRETAPVTYDAEWIVRRSTPAIRSQVRALINRLAELLPTECEFEFRPRAFYVQYRGVRCMSPHLQQKKIRLHIPHSGDSPTIDISPDTDLAGDTFTHGLLSRFDTSRTHIDQQLDRS